MSKKVNYQKIAAQIYLDALHGRTTYVLADSNTTLKLLKEVIKYDVNCQFLNVDVQNCAIYYLCVDGIERELYVESALSDEDIPKYKGFECEHLIVQDEIVSIKPLPKENSEEPNILWEEFSFISDYNTD